MITRRHFLITTSLTACSLPAVMKTPQAKTTQPNVVIVFPDQFRAHAMGFMKEDKVFTPNLDAFAAQSHTFTQAISTYPVCSPFRGMLMSGAYPLQNGAYNNCTSSEEGIRKKTTPIEMHKEMVCWSDVLAKTGYDQYYIGKWHLDSPIKPWIPTYNNNGKIKWNEWCPPARRHGFNHWYAYGTYDYHLKPMYWDTDASRDGFRFVEKWGPIHEVDRAIDFIKHVRDKTKPFSVVLSMNPPHTGYELVPKRYVERYKDIPVEDLIVRDNVWPADTPMGKAFRRNIKNYQACVTGVDEQFGRLLTTLKAEGLDENTVVFFFSDHGDCLGSNGCITKGNPHEESIRIPMIIRWTGTIKPTFNEALIEPIDLAPTILGLTGNPIPEAMVGRNLAPYLLGEANATAPSDWQLYLKHGPHVDLKCKPYTLDTTCTANLGIRQHYGQRGVRTKRHTCVFHYAKKGAPLTVFFFDREIDRFERSNLADRPESLPQILAFRKQLKARLIDIGDPFAAVL